MTLGGVNVQEIVGTLDRAETKPSVRMECFLPPDAATGRTALVIFPGGGYGGHAPHEGRGYAEWFAARGVACFVAEYRLGSAGHRHPAMVEDALAAIATVRRRAAEFGVNPRRIGVMGSSAGGHLAAHALVGWGGYAGDAAAARPDFGVLCYPVIAMRGRHHHGGSRLNLIGRRPSRELIDAVSVERLVTAGTPPCFLWHTGEDSGVPVENSLLFAAALRRHGVPFELHVYEKGSHGLGLGAPFPWAEDVMRWVQGLPDRTGGSVS
jgi:acetyl esterase/lipase